MASLNERLDSVDRLWKGFPNLHLELGSYSFFAFTPRICMCDGAGINEAFALLNPDKNHLSVEEFNRIIEPIKVLAHEWTHWIDHTTTLWGMELINAQFAALAIREDPSRLQEEGRSVVRFVRDTKLLHYPEYYTSYGPGIFDLPWKYDYSMGRTFDVYGGLSEDPLVFTRFLDVHDRLIVRVPFSVASLLECSAMAQEMSFEIGLLLRVGPEYRAVEERLLRRRAMDFVYDPMLGVYSVAVHCVSNSLKNKDSVASFRVAYHISRLCLNFPNSKFQEIKIPDGGFAAFGDGVGRMLERGDRGFLYLLLASHLDEENCETSSLEGVSSMLEGALSKVGISSLGDLEAAYWAEYESRAQENIALGNPILSDIVNEAVLNAKEVGFLGSLPMRWDKVTAPVTVLKDGTVFEPVKAFLDKKSGMSQDEAVEYLEKMGRLCHEFNDACIAT